MLTRASNVPLSSAHITATRQTTAPWNVLWLVPTRQIPPWTSAPIACPSKRNKGFAAAASGFNVIKLRSFCHSEPASAGVRIRTQGYYGLPRACGARTDSLYLMTLLPAAAVFLSVFVERKKKKSLQTKENYGIVTVEKMRCILVCNGF